MEVDFYLPDVATAMQVSYSIFSSNDTFKREIQALIKFSSIFECRRLLVITYDEEQSLEVEDNHAVEIIPIWKWLLSNKGIVIGS